MNRGKLYICPTPIGNLEDITLRTLRVLREVNLIAAEDTRHTLKLLNFYEIKTPLTSYHEHNLREKGEALIEKLKEGINIALVSDAGMPGISDPGEDIISLALDEGIDIEVLPGATASITALVASGLSTSKFVFEGFLPSKKGDRKKALENLKEEKRTIILYESPHRLMGLLNDMMDILEDRKIAIGRELTKLYEEIFRGSIAEAIDRFGKGKIRGEFVIIIEGNQLEEKKEDIDIEKELRNYIDKGHTKREAVEKVSEDFQLPKNLVYKHSLKL